jgi:hypothetical protein
MRLGKVRPGISPTTNARSNMEAQPQQQEDRPAVVDAEEAVPITGDEEEELDVRERERERACLADGE